MEPAIRVENLGKLYRVTNRGERANYATLRETVMHAAGAPLRWARQGFAKPDPAEDFWALKGVDFEVMPGEVVGVIGRNGAGKSTLLKILSRITKPTTGRVTLNGRVGSLLEVGTGFHPELTGRENVYLNGSILGMTRREIAKKFDEIVAFAEVERFLDTPVKRYSSGMYVRLAFAVAAHLEPEILIVDEVLAVGDAEFQKKCMGKMQEVGREGRTVLFVSHSIPAIRSLCSYGIVLKNGGVATSGDMEACISQYMQGENDRRASAVRMGRPRGATAWMREARVESPSAGQPGVLYYGDALRVAVDFECEVPTASPQIGLVVTGIDGTRLLCTNNNFQDKGSPPQRPTLGGTLLCEFGEPLSLMAGTYNISLWFGTQQVDTHVTHDALSFEVIERDIWGNGKVPPKDAAAMWWPCKVSTLPDASPRRGT